MSAFLPQCVEEEETDPIEENVIERCRPHEIPKVLSEASTMLRTRVVDRGNRSAPRLRPPIDEEVGVRRITRESVMYAKHKAKKVGVVFRNVAEKSGIEGTSYLLGTSIVTKFLWLVLLCSFISLTTYQVYQQVRHYLATPISTNTIAEYPEDIVFPAIAICNNNQFRLTQIATKEMADELNALNDSISIYDYVLRKRGQEDAFDFLMNTTHQKEKMILSCRWPDGTLCSPDDFEVLWTYTGVCYTINSNASTAKRVKRSGVNNALELLLNVENYEAIRDCSPFQRTNLPGFHVLIYEQHNVPASSKNGISIPTGFSVGIPMKPQHRTKIPISEGGSCISHDNMSDSLNSCLLERAFETLAVGCHCSFDRRILAQRNASFPRRPACTVRDLVECINPMSEKLIEVGCQESCVEVEYLAWQMLALLPEKIFAPTATHNLHSSRTAYFDDGCTRSHLTKQQTEQVIRDILHASEVDTRNNRQIREKTKATIAHMRRAMQKLIDLKWGPTQALYQPAFKRLFEQVDCYRAMRVEHQDMAYSMESDAGFLKPSSVEEILEKDPSKRVATNETSLEELQSIYGSRFKKVFLIIDQWYDTLDHFWAMYKKEGYFASRLQQDLHVFWEIMDYVNMFEAGNITRYQWANFMDQQKLKSFYTKLFPEVWYEPTFQDYNDKLVKVINQLYDEELDIIDGLINDTEALEAGASALLYSPSERNVELFKKFVVDLRNCTFGELKTKATAMLHQLNEVFSDFNEAYAILFLDDLPNYLAQFDWERRIAPENFANVKLFFYKMSIEHWVQSRTYSVWSLACDIGGTMGLFLGCSILTLIELVYLFAYECFGWRSSVRSYKREKRDRRPRRSTPPSTDDAAPFAFVMPPPLKHAEYRKRTVVIKKT